MKPLESGEETGNAMLTVSHFAMRVDYTVGLLWRQRRLRLGWLLVRLAHGGDNIRRARRGSLRSWLGDESATFRGFLENPQNRHLREWLRSSCT